MPIPDEDVIRIFSGHPVTRDNVEHYRGRLEHQLLINRCAQCGHWHHPPGPICPACWSTQVVATPVAGTGTIYLTMLLHQGPPIEGVTYAPPYPVVTVELDEQPGLRFTGTVPAEHRTDLVIGSRVALHWAERAGLPIPVFHPLTQKPT